VVASVSVVEVLVVVAVWLLLLVPAGITVAKGHVALFAAGFVIYGAEKLERSKRRYPEINVTSPSRAGLAAGIGFGLVGAAFAGGVIVGLAS
jgi:hypothetical protein